MINKKQQKLQIIILAVFSFLIAPACLSYSYIAAQRENWTLFGFFLTMGIYCILWLISIYTILRLDAKFQEIENLITQLVEEKEEEKEQE